MCKIGEMKIYKELEVGGLITGKRLKGGVGLNYQVWVGVKR